MTENQIVVEPTRPLEPGEVELMQLTSLATSIKHLRMKLRRSIIKRDELIMSAIAAGKTQRTIATAAQTTQARVAQIALKAGDHAGE